ncbi:transmembrane emp24 domain-containing protein 5 precursor, partial [Reticulomyxa filosa]
IESKSIECYWHNMNDIKKILQFEYDVREGGDLDIGFSIFNPENNELFKRVDSFYKMEKSIQIKFQIEQEKEIGIYKFCFDNTIVSFGDKRIKIHFPDNLSQEKNKILNDSIKTDDTLELSNRINLVDQILEYIFKRQQHLNGRRERHIYNSRAITFAAMQIVFVILIYCIQAVWIQFWFQRHKKNVNKYNKCNIKIVYIYLKIIIIIMCKWNACDF